MCLEDLACNAPTEPLDCSCSLKRMGHVGDAKIFEVDTL